MSIVQTIVLEDNEILVKKKAYDKTEPNYYRVGNGTMNKHKIQSIDLLTIGFNSSSDAQWLILKIKDSITWDNDYNPVVKITPINNPEKQKLLRGYKELHQKDIVRRVKQGHYMLNPNALIPLDYPSALATWEASKKYKVTSP
jgi:hypothetical protein